MLGLLGILHIEAAPGLKSWTQSCKAGFACRGTAPLLTRWFKLITATRCEGQAGHITDMYPYFLPGRIWHKVFFKGRSRMCKWMIVFNSLNTVWIYSCQWFTRSKGQVQCEFFLVINFTHPARMPGGSRKIEKRYLSVPPTRHNLIWRLFIVGI